MDETKIEKARAPVGAGLLRRLPVRLSDEVTTSVERCPLRSAEFPVALLVQSQNRMTELPSNWFGPLRRWTREAISIGAVKSLAFGINDLCATGRLFSDQSKGWVLFHKIAQLPKAIIARVEIGQQL
jgi:hypothetical protein